MGNSSSTSGSARQLRDQFINQFYVVIPKEVIESSPQYMTSDEYHAELKMYGKPVEDVYQGLSATSQLAPVIADYVAYEMSNVKYADISEATVDAEADMMPLSNKDGFEVLKSLTDSDLHCAIADITAVQDISFEIYNTEKKTITQATRIRLKKINYQLRS